MRSREPGMIFVEVGGEKTTAAVVYWFEYPLNLSPLRSVYKDQDLGNVIKNERKKGGLPRC